jgi:hypothetical protein
MAHLTPESAVTIVTGGADTANSRGTAVTSSASSNTKGSWAQITSSIPSDVVGVWLNWQYMDTYRMFMDLSVGSGNSIVVNDLYLVTRINMGVPGVFLPLALPAGEPLYARVSAASGTKTIYVTAHFVCGSFNTSRAYSRGTTYGATVASTSGVTVDPGAVGDTKGSWTQITASTTNTIRSLLIAVGQGYDTYPAVYGTQEWLFDVGIGAAASEQVLIANLPACSDSSSDTINQHWYGPFDVTIPASTRIAIRCQSDVVSDASTRLLRFTAVGFD